MTTPRSLLSRWPTRRLAAGALVLTLGLSAVGPSFQVDAQTDSEAAREAAREIQAARDRANAAAQALFDAESRIDTLTLEIAEAERELAAIEGESNEMRRSLEASAVRRFTQSGGSDFILLGDFDDANDDLTAKVLAAVTVEAATVDLDDFDAVIVEVDEARRRLERGRAEAEQASIDYAALQQRTEEEIARLIEVEEQRQIDEAIERELQRQREERARQERAAAEAQAAADRQAAERAATAAAAASSNSASSSTGSAGTSSGSGNSSTGSSSGSSSSGSSSSGSGASAPPRPVHRRMPVAAWSVQFAATTRSPTPGARHVRAVGGTRVST